jgi:hypothetical protein
VPSGYPGARAPPKRAGTGSLLDLFGRDFTLLAFGTADTVPWEAAATELHVPLTVVHSDDAETRALYGAGFALIRPDHHIAWRGDDASAARAALARAVGR